MSDVTGIERLRELAELRVVENRESVTLRAELRSIADQIEHEQGEHAGPYDYRRIRIEWAIRGVLREMERHVSGVEGMDDSPVARWARELRGALGGRADEEVEDVATVRADAMEAWRWVREHGGLDHVKAEWCSRIPFDVHEKRRRRLLDHIAECETALGRRNVRIDELGHRVNDLMLENAELRRRAMPEGCEWPTVDGRKVDFKTPYQPSLGVLEAVSIYSNGACEVMSHDGIIKPVSEIHVVVPAADGEPLEVGQTVWSVNDGREYKVVTVESPVQFDTTSIKVDDGKAACGVWIRPDNLTHQRPVLDAEGNRIEPAMDVWWVCEGDERGIHAEMLHVDGIDGDGIVECSPYNGGTSVVFDHAELYVKKPVLDADGVPIKKGDTVWSIDGDGPLTVESVSPDDDKDKPEDIVWCGEWLYDKLANQTIAAKHRIADQLTHTKPEPPDSLERIEKDAEKDPCGYFGFDGEETCGKCPASGKNCEQTMALDIVRRAKKLAGVDND